MAASEAIARLAQLRIGRPALTEARDRSLSLEARKADGVVAMRLLASKAQ